MCYDELKLSVSYVIDSQNGSNGDGKLIILWADIFVVVCVWCKERKCQHQKNYLLEMSVRFKIEKACNEKWIKKYIEQARVEKRTEVQNKIRIVEWRILRV